MYREGPQGTPFHTLLAEGYVDGPIDVCKFINVRGITILFISVEFGTVLLHL